MKLRLPQHRDYVRAGMAALGNLPDLAMTTAGVMCTAGTEVDTMAMTMVAVHATIGVAATISGTRGDSVRTSVFAAAEYAKVVGFAALSTHPAIGAAISGSAMLIQVGLGLTSGAHSE
jgi:hypothetical protein